MKMVFGATPSNERKSAAIVAVAGIARNLERDGNSSLI
jgi:hypothetical protein